MRVGFIPYLRNTQPGAKSGVEFWSIKIKTIILAWEFEGCPMGILNHIRLRCAGVICFLDEWTSPPSKLKLCPPHRGPPNVFSSFFPWGQIWIPRKNKKKTSWMLKIKNGNQSTTGGAGGGRPSSQVYTRDLFLERLNNGPLGFRTDQKCTGWFSDAPKLYLLVFQTVTALPAGAWTKKKRHVDKDVVFEILAGSLKHRRCSKQVLGN